MATHTNTAVGINVPPLVSRSKDRYTHSYQVVVVVFLATN
jgi:hypothetical protein